jgi:NTE family protein
MRLRGALLGALLLSACLPAIGMHDGCPAPAPVEQVATAPLVAINGIRVGLALGSGSMHGLAHIGVIEELEARGLDVRVVAGTSVGALVGGLWASGMSGSEIANLSHTGNWDDVGRFAGSWQGLLSNAGLREQLTPLFKGRPIEAWPRRFGAVATNLANGHRRILMSGDGALAIQASSAVPVFFAPVTIGGARLVDGALVEPVPVDAARAMGAEYVIAVDVAYRPYEEPASGLAGNAFQSMHILINSLAERQLRDADFVIKLDLHQQFMECGENALIVAGREAVRRSWPQIASALKLRAATR